MDSHIKKSRSPAEELAVSDQNFVKDCFHCGETIPDGLCLFADINGVQQPMCCTGCKAVAGAIVDFGLQNYYKYRTGTPNKPEDLVPEELKLLDIYDDEQFQSSFIETDTENIKSVNLVLEGVVCPACTWLIERRLSGMDGIKDVSVNYASNRAGVTWQDGLITLSEILKTVQSLGYRAFPFDPKQGQFLLEKERKSHLRRLGLAGLLGMQVMMLSIALYAGDWSGMETRYRQFFHWICLLLTTPVMFYSARPFFARAWRDLRLFHTGMDVPVSLGLAIAYTSSVWATISGEGHVYYDSVVMFVFLLLTARYFEFSARKRAMRYFDEISGIVPAVALKVEEETGEARHVSVPVVSLEPGDTILVRPGETVCADGAVIDGTTAIDESILTGESVPVKKVRGEKVLGGSVNIDSPVLVRVEKTGRETQLSSILGLVNKGLQEKGEITAITSRVAAWFVSTVLVLAACVAVYWWLADRDMWIPVTISVLVITCPCALSLATPVAVSSASASLMAKGLIVINNNALETLNRATHFIFDKTGTLTTGKPVITGIAVESSLDRDKCLSIAGALEKNSEHPIAAAVLSYDQRIKPMTAKNVVNYPASGLCGSVENTRYYLGTEDFIHERAGIEVSANEPVAPGTTIIILADDYKVICRFHLSDELRTGADKIVADIQAGNREVCLISGDSNDVVTYVARTLGINEYYGRMKPEDKLGFVSKLINDGKVTVVIGDGINDAPVLAKAHTSIAMGAGVDIAKLNADMILMNNNLEVLRGTVTFASKTTSIIRQNFCWAIGYNLLAIPVAVAGLVAPWMAAIGMSLSSLLVVGNSLRLNKT